MKIKNYAKSMALAGMAALSATGFSQASWQFECWDIANVNEPISNTFGANAIGNDLMLMTIGLSGTVTYGGQQGPCFSPSFQGNAAGRFGYMIGPLGSVQSDFDDFLVLTMGMPFHVVGAMGYATIVRDGAQTRFGNGGFTLFFVGASDRYMIAEVVDGGLRVNLRADSVGDAMRLQWTMTNLGTASVNAGLRLGHNVAMLTNSPFTFDATGSNKSHSWIGGNSYFFPKVGYTYRDGGRQVRTMSRFVRSQDPSGFPKYIDFLFGQTDAYGFRVENQPSDATTTNGQSDATTADEFVISDTYMSPPPLGAIGGDGVFNWGENAIIPDTLIDATAYIQNFPEQAIPAGGSRQIVNYVRSPWAISNYTKPYAVVVDAPRLLATDPNGMNGLTPNPMTIRVYVDNIRGFTTIDQEVPLNDVRVTLTLPAGLTFAAGTDGVETLPIVPPREIRFVDYQVEASGQVFGNLPISVKVEPTPGPVKTVTGTINVSATPRLNIAQGANLVAVPWQFTDTSWSTVLGLNPVTDFVAYAWDPQQFGYVLSTSAERGKAAWLVSNLDLGSHPLQGTPRTPTDVSTGGMLTQLKSGWNLVGNPYPFAITLGGINGVSAANPTQSYTWTQLVSLGYISGEVAYWDAGTQSYKFIQGQQGLMEPNRGYWIHVNTLQDFTLSWPYVTVPFLPDSNRSADDFKQTADQWRLRLVARTEKSMDDWNFVGVARSAEEAKTLTAMNPPMGPTQNVDVAIVPATGQTRQAAAYAESNKRHEWTVEVNVKEAGRVTLTWPNIGTVPSNMRFRLVDKATNVARDLRQASGYTFDVNEPGVRTFTLQMEPGASQKAVIGNVVVSRPTRDANAPFTISYTLSTDSTTSIRVLSGTGKEVYTISRGRSDAAGQNTAVWTLRDNANRAVAPGTYRVEILAESATGERVRKTVPLNVIR